VITLKEVMPGSRVIVQKLTGRSEVKRRLMDMGIIPGTEIHVQKVAPLGDPVEIKFKGYNLSLRWSEAETIFVELVPDDEAHNTHDNHSQPVHHPHRKRRRFRFAGRHYGSH